MTDNGPAFPSLEHCVESIDEAYKRLGHRLGWRFLAGSRRTFTDRARFGFITLNPGGTHEDPEHPRSSSENGSAYWIESWKGCPPGTAPLQRQIQELFNRIVRVVGASEPARDFVETRVLMAHFVPFRSLSLERLHRPGESIAWARQFWSDILAAWTPWTILTIDRETFKNLHGIISDGPAELVAQRQFPTGWGRYTAQATRFRMPEREEILTLARLPHLSRFHLMSSETCRQPVQEFLSYVYAPDRQVPVTKEPSPITHPEDRRQRPQQHLERDTPRDLDASVPHQIYSGSHSPDGTPRLSGIDGADLYPEWEAHLQDLQARAAFCLLVDLAASSFRLVLSFRRKGVAKTCCLHDQSAGRAKPPPYAFIVNKSWVKFYFRLPEVRSGRDRLKRDFDSFDDGNSKGEWTVKLRTENDVRRLLTHVDRLG